VGLDTPPTQQIYQLTDTAIGELMIRARLLQTVPASATAMHLWACSGRSSASVTTPTEVMAQRPDAARRSARRPGTDHLGC
jgi:hypothetical protein